MRAAVEPEFWLCGECFAVNDSRKWGGTDSTAICPACGFEHRDDESSWVEAGTEIEMQRKRRIEQEGAT
jgi:hypothetical protein